VIRKEQIAIQADHKLLQKEQIIIQADHKLFKIERVESLIILKVWEQ
jgi:hypothetical protein